MANWPIRGVFRDSAGNAVASPTVTVYRAGTTSLATIYSTVGGTPLVNPFTGDADGEWEFYVKRGVPVKVKVEKAGFTSWEKDWIDTGSYHLDVHHYGAVGDGTTDDTAAVTAAVAAAAAAGAELHWPEGTYKTTASIPSLHAVRHRGLGIIERSGNTFAVEAREGNTNTVYFATTGSDANDGLSSSQPTGTTTTTHTRLEEIVAAYRRPMLDGKWIFKLAAGTYTGFAVRFIGPLGANYLDFEISGPAVSWAVPTAIVDTTTTAFRFESGAAALIKDIKADGNSTGNRGLLAEHWGRVFCSNFHVLDMTVGGVIFDGAGVRGEYRGGTVDNCVVGVAYVSGAEGAVEDNGTHVTLNRPKIQNCTGADSAGVRFREMASGHCDFAIISNCDIGLDIDDRSNCHFSNNDFTSNTVGWQSRRLSTAQPVSNTYTTNGRDIGVRGVSAGIFTGHGSPAAGATSHGSPTIEGTTANRVWIPMPFAGKARNLRVRMRTAPGTGETMVVTLQVNGVDSTLIGTVSGTGFDASDLINEVDFVAGDRLSLTFVASNNGSYAGDFVNAACELVIIPY